MKAISQTEELLWTCAHLAVFAVVGVTTYLLRTRFKTGMMVNAVLFLGGLTALAVGVGNQAAQTTSKYSMFDVRRCATKREIQGRFRQWSRTIHPDQPASADAPYTFEELDALKDFLLADHTRALYDKFGFEFDHQLNDETMTKSLVMSAFQQRLFVYLNSTFIWVLMTFVLCKAAGELDMTNFLLKMLLGKAFVVVNFWYSQAVDECSPLDRLFPRATIHQQTHLAELLFSFFFGIVAALVFISKRNESRRLRAEVEDARATVERLQSDAPTVKELRTALGRFRDWLAN